MNNQMFKNNPAIQGCANLGTATINSIQYNLLVDYNIGVFFYDSNWMYKSTLIWPNLFFRIVANGSYYLIDRVNGFKIIKILLTSPLIKSSYGSGYRSLHYDSIGSRIIAAGCEVNKVDILDLDLNISSSVSTPGLCPHDVTVYNTKIYVAVFNNGNVVIISNGVIENTYSTMCSQNLDRVSIDSFGYIALSCSWSGQVYLYDSNMNYTNKSISFGGVCDARLDTNKRLTICGGTNVVFYT
jgi:hypothetical protein